MPSKTKTNTSARHVHAVLAAAMDNPSLLEQWRLGNSTNLGGSDNLALDLEKVWLFAGLATKVRQNDVRLNLPLTFKLLDRLGISIEVFAGYARKAAALRKANQRARAEKIVSLSEFLEDWLDRANLNHALVRDIIKHERALVDLNESVSSVDLSTGVPNIKNLSRLVPLRCEPLIHHEMSCNPLQLEEMIRSDNYDSAALSRGHFFFAYRWNSRAGCISVAEIDELDFILIELTDGFRSLTQIAALLRQAGVALKTADLRATIGELVENGLLKISSPVSRNTYRAVGAG